MAWTTEASAVSAATPEQVWAQWIDVSGWSQWDDSVDHAEIDGPFEQGMTGWLKPSSGPKARFTLTEVTANRTFTNRSRVPLGSLEFAHSLTSSSEGTVITHRVTMQGPLTFILRRVVGRRIERDLPSIVDRLATIAAGHTA